MLNRKNDESDEWALLFARSPGSPLKPIGILLRDARRDTLHLKLWPEWWSSLPDGPELWGSLSEDLQERADEEGAAQTLNWMEDTFSHVLEISARQPVRALNTEDALNSLYQKHVVSGREAQEQALQPFNRETSQIAGRQLGAQQSQNAAGQNPFPHHRRAHSLVAAGLIIVAILAATAQRQASQQVSKSYQTTHNAATIPMLPAFSYQPTLLNISSMAQRIRSGGPVRRRKSASHLRKQFRPQDLVLRTAKVNAQRPEIAVVPPQVQFNLVSGPTMFPALPKPVRFRRRRNRFIRVLFALARPLKGLGTSHAENVEGALD